MHSIAKLLKDTRKDLDLSQIDVMKKTGISNKALSRYENDFAEPDIKTLSMLFELYGLSLDRALGLRHNESSGIILSAEEKDLICRLRKLPPELRSLFLHDAEIVSSFCDKEK